MRNALGASLLALAITVSSEVGIASAPAQAVPSPIPLPTSAEPVSYQLGNSYDPEAPTGIVIRDRTAVPVAGYYNICYVNGFQTQAEQTRWWVKKHPDLLLRKNGRLVRDNQWNEVLLDTSKRRKQRALARIIGRWVDGCARKGFAAVEFDNLDSYQRSQGRLRPANSLSFAKLLVSRAHRNGLAAGQKNSSELGARGKKQAGFDFAIAEECERFRECGVYLATYGTRVIEVEYTDYSRGVFARACDARAGQISVILRDRQLRAPGHPDYRSEAC